MSQLFASGVQSTRVSASTSVLLMNTQDIDCLYFLGILEMMYSAVVQYISIRSWFFTCVCVCVCVCVAMLHGLWDLISLTRNQTQSTPVKTPSPNHWATKEFTRLCLLTGSFNSFLSLLNFCSLLLSITEGGVLKSQTMCVC